MKRQTPRLTRRQRMAAIVLAAVAACFLTLDLDRLEPAAPRTAGCAACSARSTAAPTPCSARCAASSQGVPHAGSNEARVHELQHENAVLQQATRRRQAPTATPPPSWRGCTWPRPTAATGCCRRACWRSARPRASTGRSPSTPARPAACKVGQTVTDGDGLVGRVLHADASTSVVLLAVDPGSGVGARDLRTGQVGVATGVGADGFSSARSTRRRKLRVGDQLDTGPAGSSSFVAGLAVGTITAVRVSADGTTLAAVDADRVAERARPRRRDPRRRRPSDARRCARRPGRRPVTRARVAAAFAALLTALLLQATLVGPLTLPLPVSLPALLVAAIALVDGPGAGLAFGFATGLIADLGSEHPGRRARAVLAGHRAGVRAAARAATRACRATSLVATLVCGAASSCRRSCWPRSAPTAP